MRDMLAKNNQPLPQRARSYPGSLGAQAGRDVSGGIQMGDRADYA